MTTSFYILDSRSFEKTELGKQEVQKSREIDEVQKTKKRSPDIRYFELGFFKDNILFF